MADADTLEGALSPGLAELLERFRAGQRAALARAISVVENERPGYQTFLHTVLTGGPHAARVGFTGPPGAGKSTLLAAVAQRYRAEGEQVGVVAVDPTSPYSGGALLGDRIRMNDLATDAGIFIRSMATRGSLGGLAATTREVIDLMDAFGLGRLLVETVGVGQTELDVTGATDTVVVVLVPESGDGIQAMKAGLMEIADIFVVNKADRPGADRLVKELRTALHLRAGEALRDVPAHHGVDLSRVGVR
ncbi:MAG: methylmalonyl Co-A mutase-associated GTPase MeaB, partial [Gemmatimonadetes bacterium]